MILEVIVVIQEKGKERRLLIFTLYDHVAKRIKNPSRKKVT